MPMPKMNLPQKMFSLVLCARIVHLIFREIEAFRLELRSVGESAFVFLQSLASLFPLVVLIIVCAKIENRAKIKRILALYLILDISSAFFAQKIPHILTLPFYSSSLIFIVRFWLVFFLALEIVYLAAFAVLFFGSKIRAESGSFKKSASFKITVANSIYLFFQIALNFALYEMFSDEYSNAVGMQAIGAAFLVLIVLAAKIVFAIPTIVLSVIGIAKSVSKDKNRFGILINIFCMIASFAQIVLFW